MTDFNLAFRKPKKDQCNYCVKFTNMSEAEKETEFESYEAHLLRKEEVRVLKDQDKLLAKNNAQVHVVTFDLQKVLLSPKLNVGALYYKRKLSTYNLTNITILAAKNSI